MSETPKDQDLLAPFKRPANLIQPDPGNISTRPAVVRAKLSAADPNVIRYTERLTNGPDKPYVVIGGPNHLRDFLAAQNAHSFAAMGPDAPYTPTEAEPQIEQDRRRADWIRDDKRAEVVEPRPDYKLFVEVAQYEAVVQENETRKRMCSVQQYMIFGLALALIAALVWVGSK